MRSRHNVLIVEDDVDLRHMFRQALTIADFDVREAGDGYSALNEIDQQRPSVIVLDLGLPNISGYAVLQELAAQAHTRTIPVVVVTGQQRAEHMDGIACLLYKPVAPDRLVNTVRASIAAGSGSVV